MAVTNEFVNEHFYLFDASFKEHSGIRAALEAYPNAPRTGFYVCPSCAKNFLRAIGNILEQSCEFDKEHYLPKNAGGHRTILSCKDCNSVAGGAYDHILTQFLRMCAFNKRVPNASLDMGHTVSVIVGHYKGRVLIDDAGQLNLEVKKDPKAKIAPLDNWIEASKTDHNYSIEMTIKNPDPRLVTKALLKIAYLWSFIHFGYEFVFSEYGKRIRQVLAGEIDYPVEGGRLFIDDEGKGFPEGPAIIQAPDAWRCLVVNVPLQLGDVDYKCIAVVPIPAPIPTGWDDLHVVADAIRDRKDLTNVTMTGLPNYLVNKELYGYSRSWVEYGPK